MKVEFERKQIGENYRTIKGEWMIRGGYIPDTIDEETGEKIKCPVLKDKKLMGIAEPLSYALLIQTQPIQKADKIEIKIETFSPKKAGIAFSFKDINNYLLFTTEKKITKTKKSYKLLTQYTLTQYKEGKPMILCQTQKQGYRLNQTLKINYKNGEYTFYSNEQQLFTYQTEDIKGSIGLYTSHPFSFFDNLFYSYSFTQPPQITTTTYQYNQNNRLIKETTPKQTITYKYDENGNLIEKGNTKYYWTYENKLKEVILPDSSVISFSYNADGLRTKKINPDGSVVNYILDGLAVLEEYDGSGGVLRSYVPGVCFVSGGSVYYYHYDRLGSVRFMSDEGGNIVEEYVYDAWGNLVSSSGSVSQPYEYLNFYSEGEIGLYLTGKRWYAPDIGRYISRNSPYLFSNNNPVSSLPVYTPPISDITTPDNPKDPLGFYFHGNWCGPGWSGGKYTDNPEEVDWSVPAIDSIDQCCKFHDWCVQHENNWWDRWVGECRNLICSCLKNNIDPCDLKKHPGLRILLDILQKIFLCENPGLPF